MKLHEKEKIRDIIQTHFKIDETGSVPCEEVHIVVEVGLEYVVDYMIVEDVFLEEFGSERLNAVDYRLNYKHYIYRRIIFSSNLSNYKMFL